MKLINLQDYYPAFYNAPFFLNVPDELVELLISWKRNDDAYGRKRFRYKAHFSLNCKDGLEHNILRISLTPYEVYERKLTYEQLYTAVMALPEKQGKRVFAHYFLGMSKAAIARAEGISPGAVKYSINRALQNMGIFMKKNL